MTQDTPIVDVRTDALNLLSSGVHVLTAGTTDVIHAATVTWVTQVSIRPPMVLVALRRNSYLAQAVRKAHRFAVNILASDQEAIAQRFFTHHREPAGQADLAGQPFRIGASRCPLLIEALAWLECRLAAEPASPGDHCLMLGEVTGAGVRRQGSPMVLWATPWSYGSVRE